jgi:hypothetical protein
MAWGIDAVMSLAKHGNGCAAVPLLKAALYGGEHRAPEFIVILVKLKTPDQVERHRVFQRLNVLGHLEERRRSRCGQGIVHKVLRSSPEVLCVFAVDLHEVIELRDLAWRLLTHAAVGARVSVETLDIVLVRLTEATEQHLRNEVLVVFARRLIVKGTAYACKSGLEATRVDATRISQLLKIALCFAHSRQSHPQEGRGGRTAQLLSQNLSQMNQLGRHALTHCTTMLAGEMDGHAGLEMLCGQTAHAAC